MYAQLLRNNKQAVNFLETKQIIQATKEFQRDKKRQKKKKNKGKLGSLSQYSETVSVASSKRSTKTMKIQTFN